MAGRLDHVDLRLVETFQDLKDMEAWFVSGPMQFGRMGVDTETTGLSLRHDRVRMIQFGDLNAGWALPWEWWSGYVQDIVQRYRGRYTLHNLPFDYPMIRKMGVDLPRGQLDDTLPMVKMIEPHLPAGLKPQSGRHVDKSADQAQQDLDEAVAKLGWDRIDFRFQPYWVYGALDPVITHHLWEVRKPVLEAQHPNAWAGWEIENAVQFVLVDMMDRGMPIDVPYAVEMRDKFNDYCNALRDWTLQEYGVSITSDQSLIRVMADQGVEFSKLTKGGAISLDKEVLEDIDHPLAEQIRKYRKISRISGTYLEYYINNHVGGVIKPQIRSTGARTGRMSVADPNLQNLPRVSDNDPAATVVRNAMVSKEGHTQMRADFDQIEMRIYAHLSQDPGLIEAFCSGKEDFFVTLAKTVFQDDTIHKKHALRQLVKNVGYGKIYGAGVEKQAKTAKVPFGQAQYANDMFDHLYPGGKVFQQQIYTEAAKNKAQYGESFILCPLSGRRHVADKGKEYALVNHLIQGMAAWFFKTKLVELANTDLEPYLILPVHDEIITDVPDGFLDEAAEILMAVMNDNTTFRVPITAGLTIGKRWGEKIDYELGA